MHHSKVKAYFQALELDVSQANVLFDLLDTDRDGLVSIEEFVDGANRLKGYARNLDVNMLIVMCENMFMRMDKFIRIAAPHLPEFLPCADAPRAPRAARPAGSWAAPRGDKRAVDAETAAEIS